MSIDQNFWESAQKSYANQEGGITIPPHKLSEIVVINLGFQPMGIVGDHIKGGDDQIAIAAYFEPAICTARVIRKKDGLHFLTFWVRGVEHQGKSVRIFPDVSKPSGANRAQTVNFTTEFFHVSRNGERDFYMVSRPKKDGSGCKLVGQTSLFDQGYPIIHSALLDEGIWYTVESTADFKSWVVVEYTQPYSLSVPPWHYGIGKCDGKYYFVTDFRSKEEHGIYRLEASKTMTLVIPNIEGNGICFLLDGSALVTRYGQSHQGAFNGIPGALIYVPARFFEK